MPSRRNATGGWITKGKTSQSAEAVEQKRARLENDRLRHARARAFQTAEQKESEEKLRTHQQRHLHNYIIDFVRLS